MGLVDKLAQELQKVQNPKAIVIKVLKNVVFLNKLTYLLNMELLKLKNSQPIKIY